MASTAQSLRVMHPDASPTFSVQVPVRALSPSSPSAVPPFAHPLRTQPANLIHAEILAVTSAMRKNQRWASAAYAAYPYLGGSSSTRLNGSEGVGGSGVSTPTSSLFRGKEAAMRTSKNAQALGLMGGFAELKLRLRALEGALRSVHLFTCSGRPSFRRLC